MSESRPQENVALWPPRAMSTQHPDNAFMPSFASNGESIKGEDEITEARYVFSTLGCDEQMWDYEGKDTDVDVVMKLLASDPHFFQERPLGRELFLTLRIPNPAVEQGMRKKVQEALYNIATSYDLAQQFYQDGHHAPIFEVILPLTRSADQVLAAYLYYQRVVAGAGEQRLTGSTRVKDWLGDTFPRRINVIPLVEEMASLSQVDDIVGPYLTQMEEMGQGQDHLRVFLARSDPALNYGHLSATLLCKIALQRLEALETQRGVTIHPILGAGGAPFRGNLRPGFVDSVLQEYPSVQTFTVQSSFKYDHPEERVKAEVEKLRRWRRRPALPVEEERALDIIERYSRCYRSHVERLAPAVNTLSSLVPRRRARRLHVGLYGYSREVDGGESRSVQLPRAITFCAALYSLGVPPELIGLEALTGEDMAFLREVYPNFLQDLLSAGRYVNEENMQHLLGLEAWWAARPYIGEVDREHAGLSRVIFDRMEMTEGRQRTRLLLQWAAETRGFLG